MQQGQVDWVAFGNTVWHASSAVLQRFAAAGIQPVTYGAGIVLSSQMRLDRVGQSRMEKAVASLRSTAGFGNLLWFGFGYQSFVHTMAETVAGLKCLAICSCLADSHTEALAAWVLSELWQVSAFPEDYEPSHSQFLALVKASAGVLSRTEFSSLLDKMLGNQMWRQPVGIGYLNREVDDIYDGVLEASNARDIASALHGLFQISRGEIDHILINGGSECAFIAAVAYWLLNLKVRVKSSSGATLFNNAVAEDAIQVSVQYGEVSDEAVQIAGTTYLLRSCTEIIGMIPDRADFPLIVRTPWSSCLSRVFGARFDTLSSMTHLLGDYLGGVARIYNALATGESNIGHLSRAAYIYFSDASFGNGFVNTVISTFPELENMDGLRDRMLYITDGTFDDALRSVESSVLGLERLCACEYCSQEPDDSMISHDISRTCIVGIAYAIRRISITMASVVQDPQIPGLLPAVAGIMEFSACGKQSDLPNDKISKIVNGRDPLHTKTKWSRASFYWNALGLHHDQPLDASFQYHLLTSPMTLFHGPMLKADRMSFTDQNIHSAISRRGVCCFIEQLRGLSCQAEAVSRVHILPGQIHCKGRTFDVVQDGNLPGKHKSPENSARADTDATYSATLQQPSTLVSDEYRAFNLKDIQVLVTDLAAPSGTSIICLYKVNVVEGPIYIPPGELTRLVLNHSGMIACGTRGCKKELAVPCSVVEKGWRIRQDELGLTYTSGTACCIWPYNDEVARGVAISSNSKRSSNVRGISFQAFLIRRHECLPCSTQAALRLGGKRQALRKKENGEMVNHIIHII